MDEKNVNDRKRSREVAFSPEKEEETRLLNLIIQIVEKAKTVLNLAGGKARHDAEKRARASIEGTGQKNLILSDVKISEVDIRNYAHLSNNELKFLESVMRALGFLGKNNELFTLKELDNQIAGILRQITDFATRINDREVNDFVQGLISLYKASFQQSTNSRSTGGETKNDMDDLTALFANFNVTLPDQNDQDELADLFKKLNVEQKQEVRRIYKKKKTANAVKMQMRNKRSKSRRKRSKTTTSLQKTRNKRKNMLLDMKKRGIYVYKSGSKAISIIRDKKPKSRKPKSRKPKSRKPKSRKPKSRKPKSRKPKSRTR